MKTQLAITDVTRMQEGRVCIAGYDQNGKCVRPVLPPPGIHERSLYIRGSPIIFPFALVEFDLQRHISEPPHTEDWRYDPRTVHLVRKLDEKERREILVKTLYRDVSAIFDVPIFSDIGHYIKAGQGIRSLGTIQPQRGLRAISEQFEGKWRYRLQFVDKSNILYKLTITDLSWRYYIDSEQIAGHTPAKTSSVITEKLGSSEVFLRIGLARGWDKFPDRCFIQITGVYTFPDYLGGKMFADFAPK